MVSLDVRRPKGDNPRMAKKSKSKKPDRIKKARIAARLTQAQAAKRCGWHQSQWARFENGGYAAPTIASFRKAAKALGCKVEDLL